MPSAASGSCSRCSAVRSAGEAPRRHPQRGQAGRVLSPARGRGTRGVDGTEVEVTDANNAELLLRLAGAPATKRTARYRCVIVYLSAPNAAPAVFEGTAPEGSSRRRMAPAASATIRGPECRTRQVLRYCPRRRRTRSATVARRSRRSSPRGDSPLTPHAVAVPHHTVGTSALPVPLHSVSVPLHPTLLPPLPVPPAPPSKEDLIRACGIRTIPRAIHSRDPKNPRRREEFCQALDGQRAVREHDKLGVTLGMMIIGGEITTTAMFNVDGLVRKLGNEIGYSSPCTATTSTPAPSCGRSTPNPPTSRRGWVALKDRSVLAIRE